MKKLIFKLLFKWRFNSAMKIIDTLDDIMKQAHISRAERRDYWKRLIKNTSKKQELENLVSKI